MARELQLAGWDVERTVITKIELQRRCLTDYELILVAHVLAVALDDLARGVKGIHDFFGRRPR